jgi:DNA-binding transcriptional regulator YiaG
MTQFDSNHQSSYVQKIRVFLKMQKQGFTKTAGLRNSKEPLCRGRIPCYPKEAVEALEAAANLKAIRCEANDTTIGERFRLARDYCGLTDSAVAKSFGVSRELVRQWGVGVNRPTNIPALSAYLGVPQAWLEDGDISALPANSHIGVRLGTQAKQYREMLYGMTVSFLAELDEGVSQLEAQAFIEQRVMTHATTSETARRAGGRWQLIQERLLFAHWSALPDRGLTRRLWSDEVEAMIEEELATKHSVYAAWHSLKTRCETKGLAFPKMVSLHKRIHQQRKHQDQFGVAFILDRDKN